MIARRINNATAAHARVAHAASPLRVREREALTRDIAYLAELMMTMCTRVYMYVCGRDKNFRWDCAAREMKIVVCVHTHACV